MRVVVDRAWPVGAGVGRAAARERRGRRDHHQVAQLSPGTGRRCRRTGRCCSGCASRRPGSGPAGAPGSTPGSLACSATCPSRRGCIGRAPRSGRPAPAGCAAGSRARSRCARARRSAQVRGRREAWLLGLVSPAGERSEVAADYVVAATGYRPDLRRLTFMDDELRARLRTVARTATVDATYQTSVPGLYMIGPAVAPVFGPVMRFVYGSAHAARTVAATARSDSRIRCRGAGSSASGSGRAVTATRFAPVRASPATAVGDRAARPPVASAGAGPLPGGDTGRPRRRALGRASVLLLGSDVVAVAIAAVVTAARPARRRLLRPARPGRCRDRRPLPAADRRPGRRSGRAAGQRGRAASPGAAPVDIGPGRAAPRRDRGRLADRAASRGGGESARQRAAGVG